MSNSRNWGEDRDSHHLITMKVPPTSIKELARELCLHKDIYDYAIKGSTFEECMARIAEKLDILLDGMYDAEQLAAVLLEALRNRRMHGNEPWKRAKGLLAVEMVEREKSVTVEVVKEGTIAAPQKFQEVTAQQEQQGSAASENIPSPGSQNQEAAPLPSSPESADSSAVSNSDKAD